MEDEALPLASHKWRRLSSYSILLTYSLPFHFDRFPQSLSTSRRYFDPKPRPTVSNTALEQRATRISEILRFAFFWRRRFSFSFPFFVDWLRLRRWKFIPVNMTEKRAKRENDDIIIDSYPLRMENQSLSKKGLKIELEKTRQHICCILSFFARRLLGFTQSVCIEWPATERKKRASSNPCFRTTHNAQWHCRCPLETTHCCSSRTDRTTYTTRQKQSKAKQSKGDERRTSELRAFAMLEVYRCDFSYIYEYVQWGRKGNRETVRPPGENNTDITKPWCDTEGTEKARAASFFVHIHPHTHTHSSTHSRFIHLSLSMIIRTFEGKKVRLPPSPRSVFAAAIFCLVDSIVPASEKGKIECQLFLTNDVCVLLTYFIIRIIFIM